MWTLWPTPGRSGCPRVHDPHRESLCEDSSERARRSRRSTREPKTNEVASSSKFRGGCLIILPNARLPSRRSHRSLAAHVDGRASAHGRSIRACGVFDRHRTRDPRWSARGAGRRERRRRRVRAATSIRRRRRRRFSRRRDKRLTRVTCAIFAAPGSRRRPVAPSARTRCGRAAIGSRCTALGAARRRRRP